MWKSDENNVAAAGANLLHRDRNIAKTISDRLPNLRHELFFWNVTRRRRRREKRDPDLLNTLRQFAAGAGACFDHPGAPLAIERPKIGRKPRRHKLTRASWISEELQQIDVRQFVVVYVYY